MHTIGAAATASTVVDRDMSGSSHVPKITQGTRAAEVELQGAHPAVQIGDGGALMYNDDVMLASPSADVISDEALRRGRLLSIQPMRTPGLGTSFGNKTGPGKPSVPVKTVSFAAVARIVGARRSTASLRGHERRSSSGHLGESSGSAGVSSIVDGRLAGNGGFDVAPTRSSPRGVFGNLRNLLRYGVFAWLAKGALAQTLMPQQSTGSLAASATGHAPSSFTSGDVWDSLASVFEYRYMAAAGGSINCPTLIVESQVVSVSRDAGPLGGASSTDDTVTTAVPADAPLWAGVLGCVALMVAVTIIAVSVVGPPFVGLVVLFAAATRGGHFLALSICRRAARRIRSRLYHRTAQILSPMRFRGRLGGFRRGRGVSAPSPSVGVVENAARGQRIRSAWRRQSFHRIEGRLLSWGLSHRGWLASLLVVGLLLVIHVVASWCISHRPLLDGLETRDRTFGLLATADCVLWVVPSTLALAWVSVGNYNLRRAICPRPDAVSSRPPAKPPCRRTTLTKCVLCVASVVAGGAISRGPRSGGQVSLMVDSGSGETFLSPETYAMWAPPDEGQTVLEVEDINRNIVPAYGGYPLYGLVTDEDGSRRRVKLADAAWSSAMFGFDLFSTGAAKRDGLWATDLETAVLRSRAHNTESGVVVPLAESSGFMCFLDVEIEPWATTVQHFDGTTPAARLPPVPACPGPTSPSVPTATGTSRPSRPALDPLRRSGRVRYADCSSFVSPSPSDGTTTDQRHSSTTASAPSSTSTLQAAAEPLSAKSPVVPESHAWDYWHCTLNHSDAQVEAGVKANLFRAKKPAGYRCAACDRAKLHAHPFGPSREKPTSTPRIPFRRVEGDVWGPIDVDDPNGFRYLGAFIDDETGVVFVQPMRAKGVFADVLVRFGRWFREHATTIAAHLRLASSELFLGELRTDRGGEMTTTWGATRSLFDATADGLFNSRYFGSAGVPQSGTPRIERFWCTLREAADCAMLNAPSIPQSLKFYALTYCAHTYRMCPTAANKMDCSSPPFASLGIQADVSKLVPFGNPCDVVVKPKGKDEVGNRKGRIIGYGVDTPGYVVVLEDEDGNVTSDCDIISSVDVVPSRGNRPWVPDGSGASVPPLPVSISSEYVFLPTPAEARALEGREPPPSPPPRRSTVGALPGDCGSRFSLFPHRSELSSRDPVPSVLSMEDADARIALAKERGESFIFLQDNPKRKGKASASADRYEAYKHARTFADLHALRGSRLPNGKPALKSGPRSGDFFHDVRHHFVTFVTPVELTDHFDGAGTGGSASSAETTREDEDTCNGTGTDAAKGADSGTGRDPSVTGVEALGDALEGVATPSPPPLSSDDVAETSPWYGRLRPRSQSRAGAASVVDGGPLRAIDTLVLAAVDAWSGLRAAMSARPDRARQSIPDVLVHAAVADTLAGAPLPDESAEDFLSVRQLPEHVRAEAMAPLPRGWQTLRARADWATGVLPAIRKELKGLWDKEVYTPIPCPPGRESEVIPGMRLDSIKADGSNKSRFVLRGNKTTGNGVHFNETATSMASQTAFKMVVALAAGCGFDVFAIDFEQAFLNSPVGIDDLLIELPDFPTELRDTGIGPAKGDTDTNGRRLVGRLNKALYGLRDAPRLWQRHLVKTLSSDSVGVRFLTSDRNVFKFEWEGEVLFGCGHVDDLLFAPSSLRIKDEFIRRIRLHFAVTGGEERVKVFCGVEFRYDDEARTITIHQAEFERNMLTKYDAWSLKPVETPKKVGQGPLDPFDGTSSEESRLDFMMFVGDLHWITKTNPRLSFSALELSHFVANPGPVHLAAARRVLANIRGNIGQGITFHGSSAVLHECYDHRHALLGASDSDFSHQGRKSTSSVSILLNGGAIYHVSRRQTTVSANSAEAEVKAAALLAELLSFVVVLWSELAGAAHPPVRCLIDNKAAKKQLESGVDTSASASYLKPKRYCESKIYAGLMWLDFIPGVENFADVGTKQVRDTKEFLRKDGILSGRAPRMFETEELARMFAASS